MQTKDSLVNAISILMVDAPMLSFKGLKSLFDEYFKNVVVYNGNSEKKTLEILSNNPVDVVLVDSDISSDYLNLICSKIQSNQLNTKVVHFVKNDVAINNLKTIYFNKVDLYLNQNISEESFLEQLMDLVKKSVSFDVIKDIKVFDYEVISNPITKLSKREYEIAIYMKNGMGNLEISNHLNIGASTVSTYKNRIFEKLQVKNIVELVDMIRKFENLS